MLGRMKIENPKSRLEAIRREAEMSRAALARAARVPENLLRRIERCETTDVPPRIAFKIAFALGVRPRELFGEEAE